MREFLLGNKKEGVEEEERREGVRQKNVWWQDKWMNKWSMWKMGKTTETTNLKTWQHNRNNTEILVTLILFWLTLIHQINGKPLKTFLFTNWYTLNVHEYQSQSPDTTPKNSCHPPSPSKHQSLRRSAVKNGLIHHTQKGSRGSLL